MSSAGSNGDFNTINLADQSLLICDVKATNALTTSTLFWLMPLQNNIYTKAKSADFRLHLFFSNTKQQKIWLTGF